MLEKPLFDCSKLGEFYDCGCAEDEQDAERGGSSKGEHGDDVRKDGNLPVEISKEP